MTYKSNVIPIAGGKGGVGKSLVAANLAISLAQMGHSTIAVDLDLGGSNLHTYLGLPNRYPGIGDFLMARGADIEDFLVQTGVPNLQFLPGDGQTPLMANIHHAQKVKLIRSLQKLTAEYVLLDLSAGSSYNNLDFFSISPRSIMVATADIPSAINLMTFLKNFVFRILVRETSKNIYLQEIVKNAYRKPVDASATSLSDLLDEISRVDQRVASKVKTVCSKLRPRIVFNMGDHPDELQIVPQILDNLRKRLMIEAECFGFVFHDPVARQAAKLRQAMSLEAPDAIASLGIRRIAERIMRRWDEDLRDSQELLESDTRKIYEKWGMIQ